MRTMEKHISKEKKNVDDTLKELRDAGLELEDQGNI